MRSSRARICCENESFGGTGGATGLAGTGGAGVVEVVAMVVLVDLRVFAFARLKELEFFGQFQAI
jgi:hypothetical protein